MKAYKGTFTKANGELREMIFVRVKDIESEFLAAKVKGTAPVKDLVIGQELVWDLEVDDWRIFNWNTTTEAVIELEISGDLFI